MSQKEKKANSKKVDAPKPEPTPVVAEKQITTNKLSLLNKLLEPEQFEKTALIILNLFFGVHFIAGILLFFFATNGFQQLFQNNKIIDNFQVTTIVSLLTVLGGLLGLFYWKRDKIDLIDFSHLTLLSVGFVPYIFFEYIDMKDNPTLFFLVIIVCGYIFYKALLKVDFSFLDRSSLLKKRLFLIGELIAIILFCFLAVIFPALEKHWLYYSQAFDLGFYGNQLYHMLGEGSSYSSVCDCKHFYYHLSPIHYITTIPFLAIFERIETLIVVQASYLILSAIPLYLLAKENKLNPFMGLILVLAFLVAPGTHGPLNYDYHEIPFFPFFFFWLFYFIEKENRLGIAIFFLLNLIIKEDIALTGICIAIFLLIYKRSLRTEAWAMLGASIFYYLVIVNGLFKTTEGQFDVFSMNFKFLAGEVGGVSNMLTSFFTNPLGALNYSFDLPDRLYILLFIFLPVVFLPLLTRGKMILLGAVMVIFGFLDINASNLRIGNQYSVYLAPIIYYLAIVKLTEYSKNKQAAMICLMLFFSIYTCGNHNFFQPDILQSYTNSFVTDNIRKQKHSTCIGKIPKSKKYSVAASNFYVPHLSIRDSVFTLSKAVTWGKTPDFVVFSTNATHQHRQQEEIDAVQALINTGRYNYRYQAEDNSCVVLQRRDVIAN